VTKNNSHKVPSLTLKLIPLLIGAVLCQFQASAQNPAVGVQADMTGGGYYPDNGPGSIGNQSQIAAENHSGVLTGFTTANASINSGASGTDANGTTGSITFVGASSAAIGVLKANGTVFAISTPNPPGSPYPHASAEVNSYGPPVAQFWDTITVSNPNFAPYANIPAIITISLDWTYSHSSSGGGLVSFTDLASGNFGLAFGGGDVGVEEFDQGSGLQGSSTASLNVMLQNGVPTGIGGSLTVSAAINVSGVSPDTTSGSAASDASDTAHFYIDSTLPGTVIADANGYDYSTPVPEPSSAMLALLGTAACFVACNKRKRDMPQN
jgi:hypothetical protein